MLHLTIHGRVQGVGYREFARRSATAAGLSGWVRNRSDGAVEALLIGPDAAIAAALAHLRQGPPRARVDAVESRQPDPDEIPAMDHNGRQGSTGFAIRADVSAVAMPDDATVAAYRATDYRATDYRATDHRATDASGGTPAAASGPQRQRIRIDDAATRHNDWLATHSASSATILTAWNPFGEELDAATNAAAQHRLQADIEATRHRWLPASGEDPRGLWQPEPGFCVFDASLETVDGWLRRYRQNAAVRIERDAMVRLRWHPQIRYRRPDLASRPA